MMNKIIILVLFFSYGVYTHELSDSVIHLLDEFMNKILESHNYCEIEEEHTHEESEVIAGASKMIKNIKNIYHFSGKHRYISDNYDNRKFNCYDCRYEYISDSKDYEKIVTLRDSLGNLLLSKHYTWKNNMLVQTIDDGVIRNIIQGKTPCDFIIIEQAKDTVSYHLDPKKEPDGFIVNRERSFAFIIGKSIFMEQDSKPSALDAIMYQWHSYCKDYHEKQKTTELSDDSIPLHSTDNIPIEKDGNFLYIILSYKYYAIIIIGIAVVCVIVVRKNRKRE